jgi:hypothetical protein
MSLNLDTVAAIRGARDTGRPVEIVAFEASANRDVRRMLWLLSIALVLPPDDLGSLASSVWPDTGDPQDAVDEAGSWPFVQRESSGWRVSEGLRVSFAETFRNAEPDSFVRAHELLVERERSIDATERPEESWFIRGRVAYYLAGVEPEESVSSFSQAFVEPPPGDRLAARMWLTSLALHQAHLLGDFARDLAFFRGFRAYVTTQFDEALELLEGVLQEPGDDRITATAEHLVGVLVKDEDLARSVELFLSSVDRSERLDLRAGEVMARNSLAWAHVELALDSPEHREAELTQAHEYATLNFDRARDTEDPWLESVCSYSAASIEWLWLTDSRSRIDERARSRAQGLVDQLHEASDSALEIADLDTVVFAFNDAAGILRDVGDPHAALDRIDTAVTTLERAPYVPFAARKLGQTGGSIRSRYILPEVRTHANGVLARLNALLRRANIERVRSAETPTSGGF